MKNILKLFCVAAAVFVIITLTETAYNLIMHALYPVRYYEYIAEYSAEYSLDEYLVMGVIKAESNYIHDAHSGVARGLMQITEDTAEWISGKIGIELAEDDIEEPKINIRMGCYYLKYLIDYYNGSTDVALAAYNAGMGNVSKWLSDENFSEDGKSLTEIPFKETRDYVKRVREYTGTYKKLYDLKTGVRSTVAGLGNNTDADSPAVSEK